MSDEIALINLKNTFPHSAIKMEGKYRVNEVAILCAGLDDVPRGYERHTRLLFTRLVAEEDEHPPVILFKRTGPRTADEIVLGVPAREGWICKFLARFRGTPVYWESIFFSLRFLVWAACRRRQFRTVSSIEPVVARVLHALRFVLPGHPRLAYTHGVWNLPAGYVHRADVIHEVNVENYNRACVYKKQHPAPSSLVLLPHFVPDEPIRKKEAARFREHYGIATPRVALTVGAINRHHKRMHHAIAEAAAMPAEWSLVICGYPEAQEGLDLLAEARQRLGNRFVHLALPPEKVWEAYAMADVFFLASVQEGFGLVIIEAMRAGLPVIVHDRELFRWITSQPDCCIPMDHPGALATFIRDTATPQWLAAKGALNRTIFETRYTWEAVRAGYYDLLFS